MAPVEEEELARLRAENAALRETVRMHELRLHTLIESLPFDFWMMDESGRYVVQNEASRRHWGEALGEREDVATDPVVVAQWQETNRRAFAGQTVRGEVDYEHAGERRNYVKVVAPVLDEGRVRAIIGVNIDITDSKRLAAQVERNARLEALGLLAGGIAHDFNNQLMAMVGNVAVLQRKLDGHPVALELLAEVENACVRARGLTRQLLAFARGGAPVRAPTSIAEVLPEMVRFALRGTSSLPELVLPVGLWPAMVDAGQLQQVIHNLVINAHEAAPADNVVRVTAENVEIRDREHGLDDGRYVCIAVLDHGVGIPAEKLARIFEPYFTTKSHGHGLGLAIVHSIARRHGGTIVARSQPGGGTAMSLYLPAADRAPRTVPRPQPQALPARRILVLDDEPLLQRALAHMLGELGCEVDTVATTSAAVERYREAMRAGRRFDAVILDLNVPGDPGGRECARRLAEIDSGVRAIVASGYSEDAALAHPQRHGFVGRLAKPFTLDELCAVMARALE